MSKQEVKLNLFQKLVKIRKSIGYQKKEAAGYGYKYVTESQVLIAMSDEMNAQNIWLEQDMVSSETLPMTIKEKNQWIQVTGTKVHFRYTITDADNPDDHIVRNQFIQHPGCDAQATGGLMTYGLKYFLFKEFLIAMDDQDIDTQKREKEVSMSKKTHQAKPVRNNTRQQSPAKPILPVIKNLSEQDRAGMIIDLEYYFSDKPDDEAKSLKWAQVNNFSQATNDKLIKLTQIVKSKKKEAVK